MKRTIAAALAGVTLAGAIGVGVAAAAGGEGPGGRVADVLAGLVSKGAISQEQADAVEKALTDAREEAWAGRDELRAERDQLLKDVLGMSAEEVREQLRAGKTLKEIAGDKAQALADAVVAQVEKRTKEAVAAGRMTQERADEAVAHAKEHAQAWLDGTSEDLGRGLLGLGGKGRMGPGGGHELRRQRSGPGAFLAYTRSSPIRVRSGS
jgi:polyhydroxyalkanoate synthesis regulator phasin